MKAPTSTKLKDFSEFQKEHSLVHEFPFWDFFENSIALSDSTLAQGLKLKGLSIEAEDDNNLNSITLKLRSFLNGLCDNTEIGFFIDSHSNFHKEIKEHRNFKSKNFKINQVADNRIKMLKDSIKKEDVFIKDIYLFIYKREVFYKSKGNLFNFFKGSNHFNSVTKKEHEKRLKALNQLTDTIANNLDDIGVNAKKLDKFQIKNLLYKFLNPERCKFVPLPKEHNNKLEQSPRESLLFSDFIVQHKDIFYDEHYHRVLTLKSMPEYTQSTLVSKLINMPLNFSLFIHIKVPEQEKELSLLKMKRRMSHSMSISKNGEAHDLESQAQADSTEELLAELIESGQKIFSFQLAIVVKDKNKESLNFKAKKLLNAFRSLNGGELLEENIASFKVFKTLIPFGNTSMARAKKVKTNNLADFLPIYESYRGDDQKPICLFRNRQRALVKYDPFNSRLLNYNCLVTGSSGSGKSFLNNLILLQTTRENCMNFIIDIGGSYRKLCKVIGGQYVDISPPNLHQKNTIAFNPFKLSKVESYPSPRKVKFLLAMLENLLTDEEGEKLPKLQKALLEEKIDRLYKEVKNPRLTDYCNLLKNSNDDSLVKYSKMLYSWTGDRPYGRLLDTNLNFDQQNDFVVFDLKGLSNFPDLQAVMILIITDFILDRVEACENNTTNKKKRILMDECWELLKGKSSSHFMEYCVRTLRKSGAGITFITQGIEEIYNHEIGSAILNNTVTKFILMQKGDLKLTKEILKLNEKEMGLVSSLKSRKREYSEAFMINNESSAVIRAYPSNKEYSIATSDFEDNFSN